MNQIMIGPRSWHGSRAPLFAAAAIVVMASAGLAAPAFAGDWVYDTAGNRVPVAPPHPVVAQSWVYDANGNRVAVPAPVPGPYANVNPPTNWGDDNGYPPYASPPYEYGNPPAYGYAPPPAYTYAPNDDYAEYPNSPAERRALADDGYPPNWGDQQAQAYGYAYPPSPYPAAYPYGYPPTPGVGVSVGIPGVVGVGVGF